MSAFICGPDHFKALAIFAAARAHGRRNVDPRYCEMLPGTISETMTTEELASAYANVLYQENIRSVLARYPGDAENLPGPISRPDRIEVTVRDETLPAYRLAPVALLKMCDCLEYQSCETENYRQTAAFSLLDRIRGALIHALPGYDDAPWDYSAA